MIGLRVGAISGVKTGSAVGISADPIGGGNSPRLIIIAGQSNGYGKCVAANVNNFANFNTPYANVQLYDHNALNQDPPTFVDETWRSLQARAVADGASYPIGTCGAEISMGITLDQANLGTWSIAKMCIDGSGLEANWISASYPTVGTKLQQLFTQFIQARLAEKGAVLGGIVWIQGEADAGVSPANTDYLTNLGTLLGGLRSTFPGNWPIVIHRLSNKNQGLASATIRSAEESYAAVHANCYVSTSDDLSLRDAAHYVDNDYATLGTRIANLLIGHWKLQTAVANPVWCAAGVPLTGNSAAVLSPAWPAGHQAGDIGLLILVGIGNNNYSLSPAAGFVELPSSPQHDAASALNARVHVWWCRATSSAMSAPTITNAVSADAKLAVIVTFRGCTATGNPWDVTSGNTTAAGTAMSVSGDTTTVPNTLVVSINGAKITSNVAEVDPFANADLANLTEQFDASCNIGAGGNLWIGTGVKAAAGLYGATTGTLATSTLQSQAAITIALKP